MSLSTKRPRVSSLESDTHNDLNVEASRTVRVVGVGGSAPSPSGSAPSEDNVNTHPGNSSSSSVFTDDILPVILDNLQILTPKDLLNFRFVSRCWRDAATAVLLNRNACDISLVIGEVTLAGDVNIHSHEQLLTVDDIEENIAYERDPPIFKYFSARPPHSLLPDLIRLILTSKKFPSNSMKFLSGCEHALQFLSSSPANENYQLEENELMKLFSLYGKKIKKLSFCSGISPLAVENLLFVHLPNLICLDLRYFEYFEIPEGQEQSQHQVFYSPASLSQDSNSYLHQTLKIEVLYSGTKSNPHDSKEKFIERIISLSPSIRAIQHVSLATLSILIRMRKAHLVKSLKYNPSNFPDSMDRLEDVVGLKDSIPTLKLSKLAVKLTGISGHDNEYGRVNRILNMILRGSKDTLEYLELHVNPQDFQVSIQIPQLRNLKCLKLVEVKSASFENELLARYADMERVMLSPFQKMLLDRRAHDLIYMFQFESPENPNRIPPNYFPALSKVLLDLEACSELSVYSKLLAFFVLEHPGVDNGSIINGDVMPCVTSLEITTFPRICKGLGKLFPNVSNLKIKCAAGSQFHNWVWKAFPKLQQFEIWDFVPCWHSKDIFSFFTGISHEVCAKFVYDFNTAASFSLEHMQFLRTRPYIGDCVNLEEFTIKCKQKFSDMFLIILKRLYGFHGVAHKGKIIFNFESVKLSEDDIKEIQEQLKPISSFIEIRK